MALTNHAVIRLAGVSCGFKKPFRDYLVLGDDVVIAHKGVALKYQELMTAIGVGIRLNKSILPSSLQGLEFARKLTCKEGNLSPFPTLLLTEGSLVHKLQFLSIVVDRVIREGMPEVPDFRTLSSSVFGTKLGGHLGELWKMYWYFSNFLKSAKANQLSSGSDEDLYKALTGFIPNQVTMFIQVTDKIPSLQAELFDSLLSKYRDLLRSRLTKSLKVLTNTLMKEDLFWDNLLSWGIRQFSGPRTDLNPSLRIFLLRYLKGPFTGTIFEITREVDRLETRIREAGVETLGEGTLRVHEF